MSKKFDIGAKLVDSRQTAWVVHAGRGQSNFRDFISHEIVYLEVPYLRIDKDILSKKETVRQALRRAVAVRAHAETTGSATPSSDLDAYSSGVFAESELQTLSGSIARLFGQAKVGDLVLVPGRERLGDFTVPIIEIGEIRSEFDPATVHSGSRASTQRVPVRTVNWLASVKRKQISPLLESKIGRPPAVRQVRLDRDTEEILRYAYSSYIFEGNSSTFLTAPKYDGRDFVVLNRSSDLVALLVAAHAVFSHPPDIDIKIDNYVSFTQRNFSEARIDNIEVVFSSPGHWRIAGATVSLAAFVALGVAILTSDLSIDDVLDGVVVTNSIAAADPMDKAIEQSMNRFLRSLDKLQLKKAMETAREAKNLIGLSSPARPVP